MLLPPFQIVRVLAFLDTLEKPKHVTIWNEGNNKERSKVTIIFKEMSKVIKVYFFLFLLAKIEFILENFRAGVMCPRDLDYKLYSFQET